MQIRAVIVDDETLARERIKAFLVNEPDVEVVAECADGQKALVALETHHPDLVFLDVHMPDLDGFGVLEKITEKPQPKIIFTTAYDKYALKAFEAQALDYLLKPFSRDRFQKTMVRVRETMQTDRSGQFGQQVASILKDIKQDEPTYIDRLVFKSKGRIVFLRVNEIQWVAAEGNYLRIHVGQESHLLRETMANLEGKLDPEKFLRIHRSTLVNLRYVKEIHPWFGDGESVVILHGGTQLSLSRGYRHKLGHLVTK